MHMPPPLNVAALPHRRLRHLCLCLCLPLRFFPLVVLLQVGQALSLSSANPAAWSQASAGSGGHLLVPDYAGRSSRPLTQGSGCVGVGVGVGQLAALAWSCRPA